MTTILPTLELKYNKKTILIPQTQTQLIIILS
jgi:hypothetical protein